MLAVAACLERAPSTGPLASIPFLLRRFLCRQAILLGTAVPLLMFLAWDAAVLGSSGEELLLQAGTAAGADPLAALRATGGSLVAPLIDAFSFLAVATSFIGFILGLNDFWSDRLQVDTFLWMVHAAMELAAPPIPGWNRARHLVTPTPTRLDPHLLPCSCPPVRDNRCPTCSRWCRPCCWPSHSAQPSSWTRWTLRALTVSSPAADLPVQGVF